jgi:large subunit ribosomal protein L29
MKAEKIRELSDDNLKQMAQESAEQSFRLRIQLATGQTEGLKKLRAVKKDVARVKTIQRQRELKASSTKQ